MTGPTAETAGAGADADRAVPLCVDLDGTLIRADLLHETAVAVVGHRPATLLRLPGWWRAGRARLKAELATRAEAAGFDPATLPYRAGVLAWLREERAAGRRLVLATASDRRLAAAVAAHLGLFDDVVASDGSRNLRGAAKAAALRERLGGPAAGFDYVGDAAPDAEVFADPGCRRAVLVDPAPGLRAAAAASGKPLRVFSAAEADGGRGGRAGGRAGGREGGLPPVLRLLRPHQWTKNLLLLVPLFVSHRAGEAELWGPLLLGVAAFSAAASSVYVFNDLLDMNSDRRHPKKRRRPLAAGRVGVPAALATGAGLLVLGLLLAAAAGGAGFLGWVTLYLTLTWAYSLLLKRRLLVDVLLLAGLYTLRLLAGGALMQITLSPWLLGFGSFMFLSLAFAKRYAELARAAATGAAVNPHRGYRAEDLPLLSSAGPACGVAAVLVLSQYVESELSRAQYADPRFLYLLMPLVLYWILRVWFFAVRGRLQEDPIAFAMKDAVSYLALAVAAGLMLLAR